MLLIADSLSFVYQSNIISHHVGVGDMYNFLEDTK